MQNIFDAKVTSKLIKRIESLTPESKAVWGKMNAAQMLAHNCVTYELVFNPPNGKPNSFKRLLLKTFIKKIVVSEKPYKVNSRTAPEFVIANEKDFDVEKERLINFLKKTQQLGISHFEGKESHSFGKLTSDEWSNMFYKHLDHHLHQFSV